MNIPVQSDHRGHRISVGNSVKLVAIGRTYHLTFVEINQNKSPLHRTNHQRAKVLIQYQYARIHDVKIKPIFDFINSLDLDRDSGFGLAQIFNLKCYN